MPSVPPVLSLLARSPLPESPLAVVDGPRTQATPALQAVAAFDVLARLHGALDVPGLYAAAVEAVERLCRGSVAALFQASDEAGMLTLAAAGPGWRSAERDAPAWLAPLSGALADLVRSELPVVGRLVGDVQASPFLAAYPCGDSRRRVVLVVAWSAGAAGRAEAGVAERVAQHVGLAAERLHAAVGLQEAAAAMSSAQRDLVRGHAERTLASLAGGTAHELNNALSVLLGVSECVLAGDALDAQTRRDVEDLHEVAAKVGRLAQRLAFIARVPRDAEAEDVDLGDLLQALVERARAEGSQVEWHDARRATPGGTAMVPAVQADLTEVLGALLRLHVESGGAAVQVRDSAGGPVVVTEVTAGGADPDDPFGLCYSRRTRWRGPVLAACRRVAAAHGWTLDVVPREGPRHRVELTLAPPVPAPGRPCLS